MSMIKRIGTGRVAIAAIAALMAMSGGALAASGNGDGNGPPGGGGPGGPPGGPGMARYMTYTEMHTYKRGKETVLRTDAGKIKAVSSTEITVTERDGNDVTISLDSDTEFHVKDVEDATAADLTVGKSVVVSGEKGAAADFVGTPPRRR